MLARKLTSVFGRCTVARVGIVSQVFPVSHATCSPQAATHTASMARREIHASSLLQREQKTKADKGNKGIKKDKKDKKGKKGKGAAADDSDDDDDEDEAPAAVVLPDVSTYGSKMTKSIDRLTEDFAKMRGGAVRSDMFNHLTVLLGEGAGSANILEVAQITMVNPLRFDLSVFDPALTQAVGNAIRDCGMGLNPVKGERDNIWTVKVTKPSGDARDALIKVASQRCERSRQDIRMFRKDGLDKLKNLKGKAGDDDLKRLTKQVEDMSDKALEAVGKLHKAKELELRG